MKIFLITVVIMTIGITSVALAEITEQQLQSADDTLRKMDSKISVLRGYVQTAFTGKIGFLDLVASQRQLLRDKYKQEKSELLDLYNQLP